MYVLGHRGQGATDSFFQQQLLRDQSLQKLPENTIGSHRAALGHDRADGIEFDVIQTADRQICVTHADDVLQHILLDPAVVHLPQRFIGRLSAYQLRDLPVGPAGAGRIPLLRDLLDLLHAEFPQQSVVVNIELKGKQGSLEDVPESNPSLVQGTLSVLEDYQRRGELSPLHNIVFSSFSVTFLEELVQQHPRMLRSALRVGLLTVPKSDCYKPLFPAGGPLDAYSPFTIEALENVLSRLPQLTSVHAEISSVDLETLRWIKSKQLTLMTWAWQEHSPLEQSENGERAAQNVINLLENARLCQLHEIYIITDHINDMKKFVEIIQQ